MTRPGIVRWLRRAEIALCAIGLSLLGGAFAASVRSQVRQGRPERALSLLERRATASMSTPGPVAAPALVPIRRVFRAPDADPLVLGRIEIPRIGVSTIVREGNDDQTLAVAVGRIPGTARPGERGNMLLAAHPDFFFRALRRVQLDDVIHFRSPERGDEYCVDSIEVVRTDETRVLEPTRDAVLTLVTSYPFEYVGHASSRFIVRARLYPPRTAAR